MTTKVNFGGRVSVYQDEQKILMEIPNKWVNAGLKGLTSAFVGSKYTGNAQNSSIGKGQNAWSKNSKIMVGTDTTTATTRLMTALTTPIGTNPNSTSVSNVLNPSTGLWTYSTTSVFNAGVITPTIGELGLYMSPFTSITPGWSVEVAGGVDGSFAQALVARCSSADGTFEPFTPDPSKSLTLEWRLQVAMN